MNYLRVGLIVGLLSFLLSADANTIVYGTDTGTKYHRSSCSYLKSSKIEMTLKEAIDAGLTACKRCKPPKKYN